MITKRLISKTDKLVLKLSSRQREYAGKLRTKRIVRNIEFRYFLSRENVD